MKKVHALKQGGEKGLLLPHLYTGEAALAMSNCK